MISIEDIILHTPKLILTKEINEAKNIKYTAK